MDWISSGKVSSVISSMISSMLMVWLMTAVRAIFLRPNATGLSSQFSDHTRPSLTTVALTFLKSSMRSCSSLHGLISSAQSDRCLASFLASFSIASALAFSSASLTGLASSSPSSSSANQSSSSSSSASSFFAAAGSSFFGGGASFLGGAGAGAGLGAGAGAAGLGAGAGRDEESFGREDAPAAPGLGFAGPARSPAAFDADVEEEAEAPGLGFTATTSRPAFDEELPDAPGLGFTAARAPFDAPAVPPGLGFAAPSAATTPTTTAPLASRPPEYHSVRAPWQQQHLPAPPSGPTHRVVAQQPAVAYDNNLAAARLRGLAPAPRS
mmetsp:Transcript_27351/g.109538  ORF Transcript_27351/g.109538 Transcript_27351/m.109538 type:complete len:325 (+) Transcript_27351:297-1271(+)